MVAINNALLKKKKKNVSQCLPPSHPVTIKRAINPLCCAIETASGLGAGPVTGCHDLLKTFPVKPKIFRPARQS